MTTPLPSILLCVRYEKAADAALAQLTLEQILETTPSATQRRINGQPDSR